MIDPSQVNEVVRTNAPASGEYVAGIDKSNPLRAVLVSHRGGTWQLMQDFWGGTSDQRRAWCRRMIKALKESDKDPPRRRFR